MAIIYVLYADYNSDEGCDSPEGIAYTEAEAREYIAKCPEFNTYVEFDLDVSRLSA